MAENKKVENKETVLKQERLNKICLIAGIVVLVAVLVIFYFSRVNDARKAERISESYLISSGTLSLEIKNLEEVSQILSDAPSGDTFVLISYTKYQATYDLEKGLKSIIDDYDLADRFYYLNVSSIQSEDNYLERINNAFDTNLIQKVPTILYYNNGKLVDVVLRDDGNPINAGDFQKLLDIYDFEGR